MYELNENAKDMIVVLGPFPFAVSEHPLRTHNYCFMYILLI